MLAIKIFYLIRRSLTMGTAKNDIAMLLYMLKKHIHRKIKIGKSSSPFAEIGDAWQEPLEKKLIVFWGVSSLKRAEIAASLPQFRCAFAFGKTNPDRQISYLKKNIPHIVIVPRQKTHINQRVANFIAQNDIQIIDAEISQAIQKIQKYSVAKYIEDYSDSVAYINIQYDIIDILSKRHQKNNNISVSLHDKNINKSFLSLDKYNNIQYIYVLQTIEDAVLQSIKEYCQKRSINLMILSVNDLFQILFSEQLSPKDQQFALIWKNSEVDLERICSCLPDYTILKLHEDISYNTFKDIFPILSNEYIFHFFNYKNSMPEKIQTFAQHINVPIHNIQESLLDKIYYRKPFKNPLFMAMSSTKVDKLGLPSRETFMSWLNKDHDVSEADRIFYRLMKLQNILIKGRKAPDQAVIDLQEKKFVLAVWHEEEAEDFSLEAFLIKIGKKVKQAYIVCLALTEENKCYQSKKLPDEVRFRTIFLNHAEDFDFLCPQAKEVHVIGSIYGFEALLAGCPVVTYGQPFYAGFGWTEDISCSRESYNYSFLQAAFVALFGNPIYAPYSGEKLTPDQAISIHHLRLRPDFSYIFEHIGGRLYRDERYPTLDLRRKYFHMIDPNSTQYILENLPYSQLGLLLKNLFNFEYQCFALETLFSRLSPQVIIKILDAIIIYCRINSLFDMLANVANQYVKWFSEQELTEQEIYQFYNIYLFLLQSNRYRDIDFPPFKQNIASDSIALYKIYAKISIYSCHYEEICSIIDNMSSISIEYCITIIGFLMEYPYGSREKNFAMRLALRQKIFSIFLDMTIANEAIAISENTIFLIRYSLMEDIPQIRKYAALVLKEQEHGIVITSIVASIISSLLNAYIVRCYYDEAELFLKILSNSKIKKEKYIAYWKRLRKIADGFIPLGVTSTKRKQQIEKEISSAQQASLKATSLQEIYRQSFRAAMAQFNLKTSEIIARVPQPDNPLGYILIPQFGVYQTAILPLLVCSLAKRGYASIILSNTHLFIKPSKYSEIYNFSYSTIDRPSKLSCPWDIDLKNKRIVAYDINFYERFKERLRILLRVFNIDLTNPIQRSYLQQFIYQTDVHLKICSSLYEIHKKHNLNCVFISSFLLVLPQVVWLDFIMAQNDKNFRVISCRTALTQKMQDGINKEEVAICAMDMACHPKQRLPFLPTEEKFQSWYKEFRKTPHSDKILAEIRSSLLCSAPKNSSAYNRLLSEKAAGKKIIVCYSRLLYDLSLRTVDGGPGHENMEDWLKHSIEIASKNENIFLVIKPHPHEEEQDFAAMPIEKLQDILPELPENVLLLHPREIKTPQLLGVADMVVLWLGTAISELTALGIPVVVCSYAGITDTPFDVKTFKDRQDYVRLLEECSCPPPLPSEQDMAAGLIKFSRDGYMVTPYKYSFFSASNDFRSIPYYDDAAIERYFKEGDPNIEHVVDQILEGFQQ